MSKENTAEESFCLSRVLHYTILKLIHFFFKLQTKCSKIYLLFQKILRNFIYYFTITKNTILYRKHIGNLKYSMYFYWFSKKKLIKNSIKYILKYCLRNIFYLLKQTLILGQFQPEKKCCKNIFIKMHATERLGNEFFASFRI